MNIRRPPLVDAAYAQRVRFFVLGLLACAEYPGPDGSARDGRGDLEGADLGGLKQRGVLAHLIVNIGDVVHDDTLLEGIWGVAAPDSRSANLQSYVSKLRRLVGPIERVAGGYRLVGAPAQVDAHRFETLLAASRAASDAVEARELLLEGQALWRGPAFADCRDLPGLAPTIRRLEDLRFVGRERRLELDLELGRHAEVTGELEALVGEHPFRESLTAMYMTALYRGGRQAEALRAAETLRTTLREELGVDVGGEVASLEIQILDHDPDLAGRSERSILPPQAPSSPDVASGFVGRTAAMQWLVGRDRAPNVRLISGTPGVGKTELLREAANRMASSPGAALVLTTRCRESLSGADHFAPLRVILGQMAGEIGRSLDRSMPIVGQAERLSAAGVVTAKLVDDLCPQAIGSLIPAADFERRAAEARIDRDPRRRSVGAHLPPDSSLAPQIVDCLVELGHHMPTVIVLDDLHWIDPATLDVVDALLERSPDVQLLAAYRPEVVSKPVAAFLGRVRRRTGDAPFDLDELASHEARAFVDALVDRDGVTVPDGTRARVADLSQGNGLFATELLRHYVEHGEVAADSDGSVGRPLLPDRVEALINSRIREVSDPERQLLEVAAVEGESFTIEAVARVAGVPVSDAVALCSGLLAERRIVAPDGHRGSAARRVSRYRFVHALFRTGVLSQLDSIQLADLRGRVADALVEVGAGDVGSRIAVVPRLYELAGRQVEAVPHIAAEAESLIRRGLNDEAATLLRRALRYATEVGLDGATQSRLHARLGFAVSITEGFASPAAERAYERAAELIGRAGIDRTTMPVAFGLWIVYASRGDFDRADRLVRAMRRVASGEGDPIGLQTEHAAWTTSMFAGRLDDAEHRIRRALATYRTADHHPTTFSYGNHDPGVCAGSLGSLTAALRGQAVLAHQRITEARRLADELGHAVSAAQVAAVGVWTASISGGAGAVEQIKTVPDVASTAPLWNLLERGIRGWAAYVRDGDAAAMQTLEGAMRSQLEMANDTFGAVLGTYLADVLIGAGDITGADEVLMLVEKHTEPMGGFVYDAEILRLRGRWHELRGDLFESRNRYRRAAGVAEQQTANLLADRVRRSAPLA